MKMKTLKAAVEKFCPFFKVCRENPYQPGAYWAISEEDEMYVLCCNETKLAVPYKLAYSKESGFYGLDVNGGKTLTWSDSLIISLKDNKLVNEELQRIAKEYKKLIQTKKMIEIKSDFE